MSIIKGVVIHFASIVTSRFEMLLPKLYFALLLWSTWFMRRTSAYCWKFLHPPVKVFFFPAFVESWQIINKSSPEPLICSYPNSFSHLSKKWLHVIVFRPLHGSLGNTGKVKHLNINRSNEQQNGRTSFKFTGCSIISSLLCLTQ